MPHITQAEILDVLTRVSEAPEDAMTTREIADATGQCLGRVRRELLKVQGQGRLLVHQVVRAKMDGNTQLVPAYTLQKAR